MRDLKQEIQNAAETMRRFIVLHLNEGIAPTDVTRAAGYSHRQGQRIFKQIAGKSLGQHIRLLRLSAAAQTLAEGKTSVLNVTLMGHFESREGFTKAFGSAFGVSPALSAPGGPPIQYFIPYPLSSAPEMFTQRKDFTVNNTIAATILSRPKRKLMLLYSKSGTDYWSFCQEQGCNWEGLLLSVRQRMDIPSFLTLPSHMVPPRCAVGAVGIEVPANYAGEVPAGYSLLDLPAGEMVYFQSAPYKREDAFPEAIKSVFAAYKNYTPGQYGYSFSTQDAPVFNFGAFTHTGARIAVPLKKKE